MLLQIWKRDILTLNSIFRFSTFSHQHHHYHCCESTGPLAPCLMLGLSRPPRTKVSLPPVGLLHDASLVRLVVTHGWQVILEMLPARCCQAPCSLCQGTEPDDFCCWRQTGSLFQVSPHQAVVMTFLVQQGSSRSRRENSVVSPLVLNLGIILSTNPCYSKSKYRSSLFTLTNTTAVYEADLQLQVVQGQTDVQPQQEAIF